jgi:putative ABC transport system substrate-binding protein
MRQAGHVEGRTYRLQVRLGGGEPARSAQHVKQAIAERPDVLVVAGLIDARLARDSTSTVPVVVATSGDLLDAGVVPSLARPGGNITGISDLADEATVKRLELIKAALPTATRVALLTNPNFPATPKIESRVEAAAPSLGITITRIHAADRLALAGAMDRLRVARADALLVGGDSLLTANRGEVIERAAKLRIPVVYYWPGTAEQGALMSLQPDVVDNFRRAAGYVDKILKGARPGELPIQQPTRYELVVNAKIAKTLGLTLPQAFLLRADRVID